MTEKHKRPLEESEQEKPALLKFASDKINAWWNDVILHRKGKGKAEEVEYDLVGDDYDEEGCCQTIHADNK